GEPRPQARAVTERERAGERDAAVAGSRSFDAEGRQFGDEQVFAAARCGGVKLVGHLLDPPRPPSSAPLASLARGTLIAVASGDPQRGSERMSGFSYGAREYARARRPARIHPVNPKVTDRGDGRCYGHSTCTERSPP